MILNKMMLIFFISSMINVIFAECLNKNIDYILIEKSKKTLSVYAKEKKLKSYRIALGFCPIGAKEKEGDGKTPEGMYQICAKNPKSRYHLSLKISYPSQKDREKAKKNNISPGGDIMIHGLGREFSFLGKLHIMKDWTLGCIALTNEEIEELYPKISVGTKVEIKP